MTTVLVIDDEAGARESLLYVLSRDGFTTLGAGTLREARLHLDAADLVILDLMLPDGNGFDFLSEMRRRSRVPVIVLSSRTDETDRVAGLEMGADDYVIKPFSPREVTARVRAVLRRLDATVLPDTNELVGAGGLRVSCAARRAFVANEELSLSRTEFDLLVTFLLAPGRVFERAQLLEKVWGADCVVGERTVDVHLTSLRKKIERAGGESDLLETVRGVGYRIRERIG